MNIDDIKKLLDLISKSDITEFELESEGSNVRVIRSRGVTGEMQLVSQVTTSAAPVAAPTNISAAPTALAPEVIDGTPVECPIVGTFYRKPSPDADVFVKVGDAVKKGDTLCIVEAMKLMNEIPSPVDGVISKINVEEGNVVEYGEVLFTIS